MKRLLKKSSVGASLKLPSVQSTHACCKKILQMCAANQKFYQRLGLVMKSFVYHLLVHLL